MNWAVLGYEPVSTGRLYDFAYNHNTNTAIDPNIALWANLYAELCPVAGIRTSIAWAQALHETGYFKFERIAKPEYNNPCGLGCSEATKLCNTFLTKEEGVRAHLGHILWYFGWQHPVKGFCDKDPRHEGILGFGGHKKLENDIRMLGLGNWAPRGDYGLTLGVLADSMRFDTYTVTVS